MGKTLLQLLHTYRPSPIHLAVCDLIVRVYQPGNTHVSLNFSFYAQAFKHLYRFFLAGVLQGPTLEARQIVLGHQQQDNGGSGDAEVPDTENQKHQGDKNTGGATQRAPVTVVFFLGGCTYAEIAALRYLTQKHKYALKLPKNVCNGHYYESTLFFSTGLTKLKRCSWLLLLVGVNF